MKIKHFRSVRSLRGQIILSVSISLFVMLIILFSTLRLEFYAMESFGDSYKSNTELNNFSLLLGEAEKAMEDYLSYHTFESIDQFFKKKTKAEEYIHTMQEFPSKNEISQKEYTVRQLSSSFLYYSNKAVIARRANSPEEVDYYYKNSVSCYNILLSQLLEYNKLLLKQNAADYEESHNKFLFNTNMNSTLFIVFVLLMFLFIYLIITKLTKPLKEISDVAYRLSKRDFDVPLFNHNSGDEIGNICNAFDGMIISIREYIDTIWEKARTEAELREKEIEMQSLYTDAQLRALQNQINPHFLFNTLNTGAQLAMMEGADKTCYFIEQVADFFRYNIQQQNKVATIDEELGLVENFVYIMKVRFGNRLEFIKDIPFQKFTELIPVMTLQPLVENCIKYGLKNSKGKVILQLKVEKKFIYITVSDNGCGMDEKIRKSVFDAVKANKTRLPKELENQMTQNYPVDESKHSGTGLINVFLRLKLNYHRDDIFDIQSGDDGVGTKFIIKVPRNV